MEPALRFEHQCVFFFFYRVDVNSCFLSFSPKLLPLIYAEKPLQPPPLALVSMQCWVSWGRGETKFFLLVGLVCFPFGIRERKNNKNPQRLP